MRFIEKPLPSNLDLTTTDELGLVNGCRSCLRRPTRAISAKGHPFISIYWCGDDNCLPKVQKMARQTADGHSSPVAA